MSLEQPTNNRDVALPLLADIKGYLEDIKGGSENVAYADTSDLMEDLDRLLGDYPWYQELLPLRREASKKIMSGDMAAITLAEQWLDQVESKLQ